MKGILLISHGDLAKGMMDTLSLFFGDLSYTDYLCLKKDDNPDQFKEKMIEKINLLNQGQGVIVVGDLIGGTPLNQAAYVMSQDVMVLGGMNLGMLISLISQRANEHIDYKMILDDAKLGIQCLNTLLKGDI